MLKRRIYLCIVIVIIIIMMSACSSSTTQSDVPTSYSKFSGQIYLYGESHGVKKILDKEFELWKDYYEEQNMRHLFVELPYYTAEYLNLWMQSDNDEILDMIFIDAAGTAANTTDNKAFYKKNKESVPRNCVSRYRCWSPVQHHRS